MANHVPRTPKKKAPVYARRPSVFSQLANVQTKVMKINTAFVYDEEEDVESSSFLDPLPPNPLGQQRNITDYERRFIRKQMRKMFTCHLDSVPIESLTSWTLDKSPRAAHRYSSCLQIYGVNNKAWNECQRDLHPVCSDHTENCLKIDCHKYMELTRLQVHIQKTNFPSTKRYKDCMYPVKTAIGQCLRFLQEQCDARPIKVVKVLRTRMDVMEDLLQEFPNMKVIHQLRDPRGTIISRWKGMRLYTRNLTQEADMLCRKMVDDIKTRRRLEEKYPRVFLEAKYERLATHPLQTTEELYLHSEIPLTGVVKDWVANMTSGDEDGTAFQLKRKNATATAYAWQNVLSPEEKREIDVVCAELYKLADYEV